MSRPVQSLQTPLRQALAAPSQNIRSPLRPTNLPSTTRQPSTSASFSTSPSLQARKAKRTGGERPDSRIRDIRYHLSHPLTPRPLRLSRLRALRHWTIHRAWRLHLSKQRQAQELALERQYNSMRDACEALRLLGEDGLAVAPDAGSARTVRPPGARDPDAVTVAVGGEGGARVAASLGRRWAEQGRAEARPPGPGEETVELDLGAAAARQRDVGRLYRIAMEKKEDSIRVPIEYARLQTDTPSKSGWDHEWKRESLASIVKR